MQSCPSKRAPESVNVRRCTCVFVSCLRTSVTKVRFGDQFQALESVQMHPQEKGIKNAATMREDKKCSPFSFLSLYIRITLTRYVHVSLVSIKYRRNLGGLNSLLGWTQNTSVNLIPRKQIRTLLSSHLLFFPVSSHRLQRLLP